MADLAVEKRTEDEEVRSAILGSQGRSVPVEDTAIAEEARRARLVIGELEHSIASSYSFAAVGIARQYWVLLRNHSGKETEDSVGCAHCQGVAVMGEACHI